MMREGGGRWKDIGGRGCIPKVYPSATHGRTPLTGQIRPHALNQIIEVGGLQPKRARRDGDERAQLEIGALGAGVSIGSSENAASYRCQISRRRSQ